MKKLLIIIVVIAVVVAGVILLTNKKDSNKQTDQPSLKSYSSDGTNTNNVGGSGTDTKPSSDGSSGNNSLQSR